MVPRTGIWFRWNYNNVFNVRYCVYGKDGHDLLTEINERPRVYEKGYHLFGTQTLILTSLDGQNHGGFQYGGRHSSGKYLVFHLECFIFRLEKGKGRTEELWTLTLYVTFIGTGRTTYFD